MHSFGNISRFEAAWDREHAFTTMIGFYRANHSHINSMPASGLPSMPVQYIYGMQDKVISNSIAQDTVRILGADNVKLHTDLGHWLLSENPTATTNDILEFLNRSK